MSLSYSFASRLFLRSPLFRCGRWQQTQIRPLCKGPPNDSSDGSEGTKPVGEDKAEKATDNIELPKAEDKRSAAKKKLNDLLTSLATSDPVPVEPTSRLELSKPKPRKKADKRKPKKDQEQDFVPPPSEEEIHIEPKLVAATKEVAESLGGDVKATESELLSTLRSHASDSSVDDKPTTNLSELFVGMKVERSQSKPVMEQHQQRSRYDRDTSSRDREFQYKKSWSSKPGRPREHVTVDVFGSKGLGIFDKPESSEKSSMVYSVLPIWDAAHQRELQLSVTHPPPNAFVEMIHWTKQGKLWTFPIDNEVGLEEEKKVGFHEHVFLEGHLEGWCPKRGPIRHFMELVCTGLSKNPHLTVERKVRHINWFKNYFEDKQEILLEIGAIEAQ